jgi:hypothetical protein
MILRDMRAPPHVGIDSHLDYICSRAQATQRALPPDGLEAWKQVTERGFEGYVAKDEASVYEGGPTRRWLKVKQKDWTVEEDGWRRRILQRSLAQIPAPRDHEPDRG